MLEPSLANEFSRTCDICKNGNLIVLQSILDSFPDERRRLIQKLVDQSGKALIHIASERGHTDILKYLIENQGADSNLRDYTKLTPLDLACIQGRKSIVEYLIQTDKVHVHDSELQPLHHACTHGHLDLVKLLIDNNIGSPREKVPMTGKTPLHLASEGGHADVTRFLLETGQDGVIDIDPCAKDLCECTPEDIAGNRETVEVFQSYFDKSRPRDTVTTIPVAAVTTAVTAIESRATEAVTIEPTATVALPLTTAATTTSPVTTTPTSLSLAEWKPTPFTIATNNIINNTETNTNTNMMIEASGRDLSLSSSSSSNQMDNVEGRGTVSGTGTTGRDSGRWSVLSQAQEILRGGIGMGGGGGGISMGTDIGDRIPSSPWTSSTRGDTATNATDRISTGNNESLHLLPLRSDVDVDDVLGMTIPSLSPPLSSPDTLTSIAFMKANATHRSKYTMSSAQIEMDLLSSPAFPTYPRKNTSRTSSASNNSSNNNKNSNNNNANSNNSKTEPVTSMTTPWSSSTSAADLMALSDPSPCILGGEDNIDQHLISKSSSSALSSSSSLSSYPHLHLGVRTHSSTIDMSATTASAATVRYISDATNLSKTSTESSISSDTVQRDVHTLVSASTAHAPRYDSSSFPSTSDDKEKHTAVLYPEGTVTATSLSLETVLRPLSPSPYHNNSSIVTKTNDNKSSVSDHRAYEKSSSAPASTSASLGINSQMSSIPTPPTTIITSSLGLVELLSDPEMIQQRILQLSNLGSFDVLLKAVCSFDDLQGKLNESILEQLGSIISQSLSQSPSEMAIEMASGNISPLHQFYNKKPVAMTTINTISSLYQQQFIDALSKYHFKVPKRLRCFLIATKLRSRTDIVLQQLCVLRDVSECILRSEMVDLLISRISSVYHAMNKVCGSDNVNTATTTAATGSKFNLLKKIGCNGVMSNSYWIDYAVRSLREEGHHRVLDVTNDLALAEKASSIDIPLLTDEIKSLEADTAVLRDLFLEIYQEIDSGAGSSSSSTIKEVSTHKTTAVAATSAVTRRAFVPGDRVQTAHGQGVVMQIRGGLVDVLPNHLRRDDNNNDTYRTERDRMELDGMVTVVESEVTLLEQSEGKSPGPEKQDGGPDDSDSSLFVSRLGEFLRKHTWVMREVREVETVVNASNGALAKYFGVDMSLSPSPSTAATATTSSSSGSGELFSMLHAIHSELSKIKHKDTQRGELKRRMDRLSTKKDSRATRGQYQPPPPPPIMPQPQSQSQSQLPSQIQPHNTDVSNTQSSFSSSESSSPLSTGYSEGWNMTGNGDANGLRTGGESSQDVLRPDVSLSVTNRGEYSASSSSSRISHATATATATVTSSVSGNVPGTLPHSMPHHEYSLSSYSSSMASKIDKHTRRQLGDGDTALPSLSSLSNLNRSEIQFQFQSENTTMDKDNRKTVPAMTTTPSMNSSIVESSDESNLVDDWWNLPASSPFGPPLISQQSVHPSSDTLRGTGTEEGILAQVTKSLNNFSLSLSSTSPLLSLSQPNTTAVVVGTNAGGDEGVTVTHKSNVMRYDSYSGTYDSDLRKSPMVALETDVLPSVSRRASFTPPIPVHVPVPIPGHGHGHGHHESTVTAAVLNTDNGSGVGSSSSSSSSQKRVVTAAMRAAAEADVALLKAKWELKHVTPSTTTNSSNNNTSSSSSMPVSLSTSLPMSNVILQSTLMGTETDTKMETDLSRSSNKINSDNNTIEVSYSPTVQGGGRRPLTQDLKAAGEADLLMLRATWERKFSGSTDNRSGGVPMSVPVSVPVVDHVVNTMSDRRSVHMKNVLSTEIGMIPPHNISHRTTAIDTARECVVSSSISSSAAPASLAATPSTGTGTGTGTRSLDPKVLAAAAADMELLKARWQHSKQQQQQQQHNGYDL
eukprot:gene5417-10843_t